MNRGRPAAEVRSLMLKSLFAAAAFLTILAASGFSQTNSTTDTREFQVAGYTRVRVAKNSPAAVASAEREAFDLINQIRADAGLAPLVWNDQVASLARLHSQDMADQK